jgi:hypothetical protein
MKRNDSRHGEPASAGEVGVTDSESRLQPAKVADVGPDPQKPSRPRFESRTQKSASKRADAVDVSLTPAPHTLKRPRSSPPKKIHAVHVAARRDVEAECVGSPRSTPSSERPLQRSSSPEPEQIKSRKSFHDILRRQRPGAPRSPAPSRKTRFRRRPRSHLSGKENSFDGLPYRAVNTTPPLEADVDLIP